VGENEVIKEFIKHYFMVSLPLYFFYQGYNLSKNKTNNSKAMK
jgi:hypothetical protein